MGGDALGGNARFRHIAVAARFRLNVLLQMVSGEGRIVQKLVRPIAIAVFALTALAAGPAHAEKRVALLLGNQAYTSEIGPLANPHNDVALLEKALKSLGFEVASVRDAGLADMHQAINAYVRRTREAGPGAVGFLYYAGHGASDSAINYLIPVDVKSAEEGDLWDRSLRVTEIVRKLKAEAGNATHFVVLDACRNTLKLRKAGSKAVVQSRGLIRVTEEAGMLIAYATAEGELASDVGVGAGPYARVLAEEIVKPGVEAVTMFRNVQRRVRAAIRQEPHLQFSALGDVYLAGAKPGAILPPPPQLSEVERAWAAVKDSTSVAVLEAFRRQYGAANAVYDRLAEARIDELKRQQLAMLKAEEDKRRAEAEKRRAEEERKRAEADLPPGRVFRDCDVCPEMVVVPAGSFMMGSPPGEEGRADSEGPQRKVTIARPFAVGKFEVTFAEWDACVAAGGCKHNPGDQGWGRGKRPVIDVSWDDITKEYLPWLSRKTGKSYRLLSEAEWEYVARAGTTTPFSTGRTITPKQANFAGNYTYGGSAKGVYRSKTIEVGSFPPNAFGLYDMHGNVWEWVQDCWNGSYTGAPSDGSAWTTGDCGRRVLRGGSWFLDPQVLRSASRGRLTPDDRGNKGGGFRVGRTL